MASAAPPSLTVFSRQRARSFEKQRLVQCGQRLQRRVRPRAAHAGDVPVRRVEGLQARVGNRAIAERVERAAIAILAFLFIPVLRARNWPAEDRNSGAGGKTLGPPTFSFSNPLAASAMSRTISASTRKRGPRASSRLYGSRSHQVCGVDLR